MIDDVLIAVVQCVVELGGDVLCSLLADSCSYRAERKPTHPVVGAVAWLVAGSVLGGLSLLVRPTALLSHPALRLGNLILAPLLAALTAHALARWRRSRQSGKEQVVPWRHAVHAGAFAAGMVLVRFLCCSTAG